MPQGEPIENRKLSIKKQRSLTIQKYSTKKNMFLPEEPTRSQNLEM